EAAISPELFRPVLPELSMAEIPPTPTPASSIARALIPREAILEALITPIAVDRPPILAPIFSTPIPVIVPTLAAPQIYEQLPQPTVTLLTPGGKTLVLDNYPGRPDLWTYEFPVTSEGGNYTLTIESQDEKQVRTIDVQGEARIFTTNLTGVLQEEFDVPANVIVNYVDFMQGREV